MPQLLKNNKRNPARFINAFSANETYERGEQKVDFVNLHAVTHQKINYIVSKAHINQTDVYYTAKEFFSDLLGLDYEFTHEELIQEFEKHYLDKKTHEKLVDFIKTIGQMEYSTLKFSQQELKKLLEDMRAIINSLLSHRRRRSSYLDRVRAFLFPQRYKLTDVTVFEELEKEVEAEEQVLDKEIEQNEEASFEKILEAIYSEKDAEKIKTAYKKAMAYYETLSEEEQTKVYGHLQKAYLYVKNKI